MGHHARCFAALVLAALAVACAKAPERPPPPAPKSAVPPSPASVSPNTADRPQPEDGHACYPPAWGGIFPGLTEDRDVVALYGPGLFVEDVGHGGGRYYTDPNRAATLEVVIGPDRTIEMVTVSRGLQPPSGVSADQLPVSQRFEPDGGFRYYVNLRLGAWRSGVLEDLGNPKSPGYEGWGPEWSVFSTDYRDTQCYIDALIAVRFVNDVVDAVQFHNGE